MNKWEKRQITVCLVIAIMLVIAGIRAVSDYSGHSKQQLTNINLQQLGDYAVSNAYATRQELENALTTLQVASDSFLQRKDISEKRLQKQLAEIVQKSSFSEIMIASVDGKSISSNGEQNNLYAYNYFKRTVLGENSIVSTALHDMDKGDFLIVSVPIIRNGKVVGTLHGKYDVFALSKIVEMQSFEGQSYSVIVDRNGQFVMTTDNVHFANKNHENNWSFMKRAKFFKGSYNSYYRNIQNCESGSVGYEIGGKRYISYYTPLGMNNWYLLKMVPMLQIEKSMKPIKQLTMLLTVRLIVVCSMFTGVVVWCLVVMNRVKKRRLQELISQAQQANAAKSRFLAAMSHEIRTPLNAVVGLTSIAQNHVQEKERVMDCLNKIQSASDVLLNIINQVLDMAAIEKQKIKLAQDAFELKPLLFNIYNIYSDQCKQKKITFNIRLDDIPEEELTGDAVRLNQILMNLISNAFKFTQSGGMITVTVSQSHIAREKVLMRFRVADTGEGMSEEMQERLFQPFEQESTDTVKKHGGSGLGLSITYHLVNLMGGSIAVNSQKGKGSVFDIEIPFTVFKQDSEITEFQKMKVLVVDDDFDTREYTAIILDRIGVPYDVAESGDVALQMLQQKQQEKQDYDVCFVDWKMEHMDGKELTGRIRQTGKQDMFIVIVSAYQSEEIWQEAKKAGADLFISKPLFRSTVIKVLKQLISLREAQQNTQKPEYDFKGKRILLAEDVLLNLDIAVELLHMVNLQVDCAEDGEEALQMFLNSAPGTYSAILMDIMMPNMDGYETTRRIRNSAHKQARTIPVFAMTAHVLNEDISRALKCGMNGHIAKPVNTEILYKTLWNAIYEE